MESQKNSEQIDSKTEEVKTTFTYQHLVTGLKEKEFKNVVFMTGAGISVSAGIPDFRSPKTGLFHNLKEYDLPYPEAIFTLDYFLEKPEPFYTLAGSFLDLDKYEATPAHHFAKLLHDKEMVKYYLTQNIDNLESKAGFKPDDVVQAHGANTGACCADQKCRKPADRDQLVKCMKEQKPLYCEKCGKPVKPDIVFYGEGLPAEFMDIMATIRGQADLLIVMGTALAVGPFNSIVDMVGPNIPKVLINMENTAYSGYDFEDAQEYPNRLLLKGKCDQVVTKLAKDCGWEEEFAERTVNCKVPEVEENAPEVDDLQKQMDNLNIKEEFKACNAEESGPIMGMFAVTPINECPHCIPVENIAPIEEFKDITIETPCKDCDHTKENWVCLKCKVIGCSRYVKSHMVAHNEADHHPIALSFADFSFWCYDCDSYVTSKHLNHVKHFYPQKFGAENASHLQEYALIQASKAGKDDQS